jgi:hypothetical protein
MACRAFATANLFLLFLCPLKKSREYSDHEKYEINSIEKRPTDSHSFNQVWAATPNLLALITLI